MLRHNGRIDGIRNILLGPLENRRPALPGLCCTTGPLGYRDVSSFLILSVFVPIPFPIIPRLFTPPTLTALYTLAVTVNTARHLTFLPERLYNSLAYICLLPLLGSRRLCCRRGGFFLSLRFYQSHRSMDIFARIILQNPLPKPFRLLPMLAKPAFPPAAHFI